MTCSKSLFVVEMGGLDNQQATLEPFTRSALQAMNSVPQNSLFPPLDADLSLRKSVKHLSFP